jgi:predicted short-subunit dehydrogenase-like oxidoreductase (DUF2520 family)
LTVAYDLMKTNKMDFEWLKPLINETYQKALNIGPPDAQTGPARRGDLLILDEHMEHLREDKDLAKLYEIVSQAIIDRHLKEE